MVGEVSNVRDALIQIVLRLRDDILKDREGGHNSSSGADLLHTGGAHLSVPSVLSSIPQVTSLRYEQSTETGAGAGVGMLSSNSVYGHGLLSVCHMHFLNSFLFHSLLNHGISEYQGVLSSIYI